MTYNYRVELKASPSSPWYFSGVIESRRDVAVNRPGFAGGSNS